MNKPDWPLVTLTVEGEPETNDYVMLSRDLAEPDYQVLIAAMMETAQRLAGSQPGSKERRVWANDLVEHAIELTLSGGGFLDGGV